MENLVFFLSRLSSLVIKAWSSCACSLHQGAPYGGGTVLAMAAHGEWWLLSNSPARYGLLAVVVVSVLALCFFREKS
jgi:hypothetical protein